MCVFIHIHVYVYIYISVIVHALEFRVWGFVGAPFAGCTPSCLMLEGLELSVSIHALESRVSVYPSLVLSVWCRGVQKQMCTALP